MAAEPRRSGFRLPVRWLVGGAALVVAGVVLHAIFHGLAREMDYDVLVSALRHVKNSAVGLSLACTGLSFAALIARDVTALRYVNARPPVSAILLAAFCGTALGNAVGFGTLTGGAVRYRIYTATGVRPDDIGRIMLFIAVGFAIGLALLGGACTWATAVPMGQMIGVAPHLAAAWRCHDGARHGGRADPDACRYGASPLA